MKKSEIISLLISLHASVKQKRENYRSALTPEKQAENHPETNKFLQTQFDFSDGQVYELQYILDRITEEPAKISREELSGQFIVRCTRCKK